MAGRVTPADVSGNGAAARAAEIAEASAELVAENRDHERAL